MKADVAACSLHREDELCCCPQALLCLCRCVAECILCHKYDLSFIMSVSYPPRSYIEAISQRRRLHYIAGCLARWKQQWKYRLATSIARRRGATIGEGVVMPLRLARKANANLVVGDHVSIQTDALDTRCKLQIGSHVIIGSGVSVWTLSHDVDEKGFRLKPYGVEIGDYVWIATDAMVLPSCRCIGSGAVVGAGSVVAGDVEAMTVVGGNPARKLRERRRVHSSLVVESLLGGDYRLYRAARRMGKKAEYKEYHKHQ